MSNSLPVGPFLTWGWAALADGDIDLHWVTGEHLSMLDEPHIRDVAAAVNQALDS